MAAVRQGKKAFSRMLVDVEPSFLDPFFFPSLFPFPWQYRILMALQQHLS